MLSQSRQKKKNSSHSLLKAQTSRTDLTGISQVRYNNTLCKTHQWHPQHHQKYVNKKKVNKNFPCCKGYKQRDFDRCRQQINYEDEYFEH